MELAAPRIHRDRGKHRINVLILPARRQHLRIDHDHGWRVEMALPALTIRIWQFNAENAIPAIHRQLIAAHSSSASSSAMPKSL